MRKKGEEGGQNFLPLGKNAEEQWQEAARDL